MAKVNGNVPTAALRRAVEAKVKESGEVEAARVLDVSRNTVVRLLSGRPMHKGTLALVAQRLGLATS